MTIAFVLLTANQILGLPGASFWEAVLDATANREDTMRFLNNGHLADRDAALHLDTFASGSRAQQPPAQVNTPSSNAPGPSLQAAERGSTQHATAPLGNELPVLFSGIAAPTPLSHHERMQILRDAESHLQTARKSILLHPFMGTHLTQGLVVAFAESRSLLREYRPNYFLLSRPEGVSYGLQPGEGGMFLERESKYHVFVYKRTVIPGKYKTIFQLVGMIETGKVSIKALNQFPAYRPRRSLVRSIGPDSLIDESIIEV